jgi:hypothetical protein
MAGFEVIVRPAILPNIRPARAQTLAPADDPSKGICEIKGTSPHIVSLSHSMSVSGSETRPQETQRRSDTARVYQEKEDGSVNRNNFVDVQVPNKIWMDKGALQGIEQSHYKGVQATDSIEITKRNEIIKAQK